jgi:hypothetical protein
MARAATKKTGHERSSIELRLTSAVNYPGAAILVRTHVSTGIDPKTRPGIGFDISWPKNLPLAALPSSADGVRLPFGVVDRDQIRALRNLLTDFLLDYPD